MLALLVTTTEEAAHLPLNRKNGPDDADVWGKANMNTTKARADGDPRTAPIRTYAQVVAAMRVKGDKTITVQSVWWYEQSALKKLRTLLLEFDDYGPT